MDDGTVKFMREGLQETERAAEQARYCVVMLAALAVFGEVKVGEATLVDHDAKRTAERAAVLNGVSEEDVLQAMQHLQKTLEQKMNHVARWVEQHVPAEAVAHALLGMTSPHKETGL